MIYLNETLPIGGDSPCFLIAEIGQNHQGSLETAKKMILEAKNIGVNCVKFQKTDINEKFTASALMKDYCNENSWGKSYGEHKSFLEFSIEDFKVLQEYASELGILFSASAMDLVNFPLVSCLVHTLKFFLQKSYNQLLGMNLPFIKIGSGDANNFALLQHAANMKKPLIVSTGMQNMQTVERIHTILKDKVEFALLHCVSSYPTLPENTNLKMLNFLKERFPDTIIGYSGHETGILISLASVIMGGKILERHFTLDKNQKGSDHQASLTPTEFGLLIKLIRAYELEMKSPHYENNTNVIRVIRDLLEKNNHPELQNEIEEICTSLNNFQKKRLLDCELPCYNKLGKSLVYTEDLPEGHILEAKNICVKVSDPKGISAELIEVIIGQKLNINVFQDNPIDIKDLQLQPIE